MKNNEKGFGVSGIVAIVAVVGLIGGIGWYVWQNNRSDDNSDTDTNQQQVVEPVTNDSTFDTSITEVDITLLSPADVSKLPPSTPESFKSYIAGQLSDEADEGGCRAAVTVTHISQVNVKGITGTVNMAGESDANCVGSAGPVWALTPAGTWDQSGGHEPPLCTTENGAKVYSEFAVRCFADPSERDAVANPNGSITSLAQ